MDWPTLAELKDILGVKGAARDVTLRRALYAAIEQVGTDLGYSDLTVDEESPDGALVLEGWVDRDDDDEPIVVVVVPNASLSAAALLLATTTAKAPDAPFGVAAVFDMGGIYVARQNPNYQRLLKGRRLRFGVA
jgi:hypothetical protein